MKRILIVLILLMTIGCTQKSEPVVKKKASSEKNTRAVTSTSDETELTIKWIAKAEKPVLTYLNGTSQKYIGCNFYTLIDAKGVIYSSGCVLLKLPDTIQPTSLY